MRHESKGKGAVVTGAASGNVAARCGVRSFNARSVTTRIFDRLSGGGEHCQCGSTSLVHAAVFDWLLQRFAFSQG